MGPGKTDVNELARRWLIAIIAVAALVGFVGMWLVYQMSAGMLYYGLWVPGRPPPGVLAGGLGEQYEMILRPARIALFAAGLAGIYVLAASFTFSGKARLHRRSVLWWVFAGLLGVLILAGQGGKYLPFVDFGSNTEAYFELIADAQYGAGALLWLIVALFVERGIPLRSAGDAAPSFARRAAGGVPWLAAFALASLACLAVAEGGNETRGPGSSYHSIERRVCDSTDVVVGSARDFEVVREPHCIAYDDRRPNEGPNVLGRCESLQFKVDVLDQVWPPPGSTQSVERVRTFRQSKVRGDFARLRDRLSVGWYDGRVGAPGPHVFYGKASTEDGAVILRNSWREGVFSMQVQRDTPRYVESSMSNCGPRYQLAEKMRMACTWDYAFVGVAKSIGVAPSGRRSPNRPMAAEEVRQVPPPLEDRTILEAGDFIEVGFEVIDDFDPVRPAPRDKQFFMRLQVGKRTELGNLRAAWFDQQAKPIRSVFFMLEDRTEPGFLDGSRRWDEHRTLFPDWKYELDGERARGGQAKERLYRCAVARAALAGEEPPLPEKKPLTASEQYHEVWNRRAEEALAKICATRSLNKHSVQVGIYIAPNGVITRVQIEKPSNDESYDRRVMAALKTIERMPPFPAAYEQVTGMHISQNFAPTGGWCWGR